MFESTFNSLLLIACLWQYVAVVQCRRQTELSGQQGQQLTTCLRNCALSVEEDGIKTMSNVKLSSRQSCYNDCLGRNGKLDSLGNNQSPVANQGMTLFFKRIKRDTLNSQQNSTPSVKHKAMPRMFKLSK
ncbi:hypothetical protein OS493_035685 [Desmophyllum pertusum]|uniref:Secreted protein n=1 Tax=Desmophyllum pertusum TaxID=174260 RepID=A0A9W9YV34_9CNID|nr:hypothetical protein OS493_035685 [Desmophyllum pertusum]